jgi:hypothetical protein
MHYSNNLAAKIQQTILTDAHRFIGLRLIFAFLKVSEPDKQNKELGTMAIQTFVCASFTGLDLVYDTIRVNLVFYTE